MLPRLRAPGFGEPLPLLRAEPDTEAQELAAEIAKLTPEQAEALRALLC